MTYSTENPRESPTDRPRRIAFCITELDPGGAERQLVRLATGLDRERFEPHVVCLSGRGELVDTLRSSGIDVSCLAARGRWDVGVVHRLVRCFRRLRPDLVQTFLFHANLAGRVAARLAGVPVVVSGIRVAERRHRWHLRLDRWSDRLVDRHVCVSRDVAEFSARNGGLSAEKLVVIPNCVDVESIAAAPGADLRPFGIPERSRVVLFVGRLEEQKDPARLLEAFRLLAPDRQDLRLVFVGRGSLESELRRRAEALNGRVHFLGHRNDVPSLLKATACLALPSRWEGMPNVVLEAMAAGTPVVAAAAEGIAELLQQGALGSIVRESGATPFAAALASTLDGAGVPVQVGEALRFVRNHYGCGLMFRDYARLYDDLLGAAGVGSQNSRDQRPAREAEKNRENLQSQPGKGTALPREEPNASNDGGHY